MTSEERARLIALLSDEKYGDGIDHWIVSWKDSLIAELKRLDAMEKALIDIEKDSDQESCLHGERAKQALGESK